MKSKLIWAGLSAGIWVLATGSVLFWGFPIAFLGSIFLGWHMSKQDTVQLSEAYVYVVLMLPMAIAGFLCALYWQMNPDFAFGATPGWIAIANFFLALVAFAIGRYLFPKEA
jgi:hypothetical protein